MSERTIEMARFAHWCAIESAVLIQSAKTLNAPVSERRVP